MSGSNPDQAAPLRNESPIANGSASASPSPRQKKSPATKTMPRAAKNQKEIVIEIAELKGKGYPTPVDLDTGMAQKKRRS
jgi:hypothetical protein